jgi:DNA-binding MarR family transcriptional regulator
MHKATRQIGLHFERRAADRNLTPQEGHLLTYLRVYAPAPISDLVRIFGVKASTMTSTLDRLESLALTRREINPDDRRSFVVSLTAHGKSVADEVQKFVEQTERDITRRVSKRDIEGFDAVMKAIGEVTGVVVRPERKKSGR